MVISGVDTTSPWKVWSCKCSETPSISSCFYTTNTGYPRSSFLYQDRPQRTITLFKTWCSSMVFCQSIHCGMWRTWCIGGIDNDGSQWLIWKVNDGHVLFACSAIKYTAASSLWNLSMSSQPIKFNNTVVKLLANDVATQLEQFIYETISTN